MAGAGKKRAKAARQEQRGGQTAGPSTASAASGAQTVEPGTGARSGTGSGTGHIAENPSQAAPPSVAGPSTAPANMDGPPSARAGGSRDESRGRRLSNAPSTANSRHGSSLRSGSAVRSVSVAPGEAPPTPLPPYFNRNVDYPAAAYSLYSQYKIPTACIRRPGFNTTGTVVPIYINSYPITAYPDQTIFQYDLQIGSGAEKRGLIMKVWESKRVADKLGGGWVFDGNKLAWHIKKFDALTFEVDLDKEAGITPRPGRSNSFRVQVRPTTTVNLAALGAYLGGKIEMDTSVLQAIDVLDHLMRVNPSKKMISIKRSFFPGGENAGHSLGQGVDAMKGIYQSIRAAQGGKLIVNVDVSNSCFYQPTRLSIVMGQITGAQDPNQMKWILKKVQPDANEPPRESLAFYKLRKLRKVRFRVWYRGASEALTKKHFVINDFSLKDAREWTFDYKDRQTEATRKMSVFEYYQQTYDLTLEHPTFPLVTTAKKNVAFPAEFCYILPGQRYPYKVDDVQTAQMIKFAVTRPTERRQGIEAGVEKIDWANDYYLKRYGLKIQPTMLQTQARLLAPPVVQFKEKSVSPGTTGRWRIDGQKFLKPNLKPLVSWGVCIFNSMGRDHIDVSVAQNFIRTFVNAYKAHGGIVQTTQPPIMMGTPEIGEGVQNLFNKVVATYPGVPPQMLVFMLGGKEAHEYMRIKKSCECRFGVVSQCMQNAHVRKCQAQYISNVLMKFNAKLGGTTARVPGPRANKDLGHFKHNTLVIGADVSHASPGSLQPSCAALTVSMDLLGCRYAAAVESNGHRVEIISKANMERMLKPLFREWMQTVGGGCFPSQIIYFRDGVSEGQFQHVLQQEIEYLKGIWRFLDNPGSTANADKVKYTVVVVSKRHHIRFFPKPGTPACDKNLNPCPGTLVEKDVTHPFEYDFYLNSHSAIQGTARPTHYHVLMDEQKMPPSELQNMIYEHCYQYMRSTTPVSIYPAVYYAHLASNRAKHHELKPASAGPPSSDEERQKEELLRLKKLADEEKGPELTKSQKEKLHRFTSAEAAWLIPMKNDHKIWFGMWYI